MITSNQLRQTFLDYFKQQGHEVISSSSLVPADDPTLLFTNAGMVQFKRVFLGQESRPYSRAVTTQRCVRAGGKHNDLEQVGYTARHHTFFEMLGNFSFGDYFKREAIQYCWDFLTNTLKLPPERLWITVFEEDNEAADIWLNEIGIDKQRFSRCGQKDNFWSMGDTGPCGPCSEVFYDHGPHIFGGPPGSPDQDGDRYVEIWNLVFMQYERNSAGELLPLPKPSVDTGMGLERLTAVLQGVHNNYDTDIFKVILERISELSGEADLTNTSMRVIADHIRACSFLLVDGVYPSNEGRGYVLRRIIRRAVRHGHKLGFREPFFYKLVAPLCATMGKAYPELIQNQAQVEHVLRQEEEQFARTLEQGLQLLEQDIAKLSDNLLAGKTIFRLYDTYGFPPDLTGDIARERNLALDMAGFEKEMAKQRQKSQQASQFGASYGEYEAISAKTAFIGYDHLQQSSEVISVYGEVGELASISEGAKGAVVLNHTPFYAESGGQAGDKGVLENTSILFVVEDTKKQGNAIIHHGYVKKGTLKPGVTLTAKVDVKGRQATALNHSATHLLHAALRNVLGTHVVQKGSLVEASRLRFDFSHFEQVKPEQLRAVENWVNEQIRANIPVETHLMAPQEAIAKGAMALFGEKYDEEVRVLQMGNVSMELCGGTHVKRTGDIGVFKIIAESGIAAGVRRIEAITGEAVIHWMNDMETAQNSVVSLLKTNRENMLSKLEQVLTNERRLEKEVDKLTHKLISSSGKSLVQDVVELNGIKVLAKEMSGMDSKALRTTLDQLKTQLGSSVIVLASVVDEKVNLVAGVSQDLIPLLHAGNLVAHLAEQVGGRGGGRPDFAQAGGTRVEALPKALAQVVTWVEERVRVK